MSTATDIAVESPADGRVVGVVACHTAADVAQMAQRARAAQPAWAAAGIDARRAVLDRLRRRLLAEADALMDAVVAETGKTREDAWFADIAYTVAALDFWSRRAKGYLADRRVRTRSPFVQGKRMTLRWRPRGLIGVIGPWNAPLANTLGDAIPALVAGNAVIIKPSERTPLTLLAVERLLRGCGLPPHVLQVATGDGVTGAALIDAGDMIAFTGSTATGRKVMSRAGETLTPVSLELGGKDPLIVLADADLERAANVAVYYGMQNSGQTCLSIERVYVEAPVYDEFLARVTEKVRALRQGPPGAFGTVDVGALTFPPQIDIVEAHVRDAVDKGARVLVGGGRGDGPGRFYAPTVLADVDHSMACMREETFGPVLPIMKVAGAEEAVRLANDSRYGLGGSVLSRDRVRGEAIARRLESGTVSVNDAFSHYMALELPMGGAKDSGVGARHGAEGIRRYCQQQVVLVSRLHLRHEPHMFPYRAPRIRALRALMTLVYRR